MIEIIETIDVKTNTEKEYEYIKNKYFSNGYLCKSDFWYPKNLDGEKDYNIITLEKRYKMNL